MATTNGGDQAHRRRGLSGCRILVVEDEMLVALDLETLLEGQGCVVLGPVSTVDRALALLDREQPDAALLDLNLNGQPVTPVARALEARGVPFVILSGYSELQSSAPELENAPRLDKPVTQVGLLRALTQLLTAS